jgi:lipopolysaccharide/colanic/teichoic acid biosynthesis glycosyltransferase
MILIFFLVWFAIGFPIFSQRRPGLNNKIFIFYKFKTLYDASDTVSKKKRQNCLGDFLRKTGLDELPQLFNILENSLTFFCLSIILLYFILLFHFIKCFN